MFSSPNLYSTSMKNVFETNRNKTNSNHTHCCVSIINLPIFSILPKSSSKSIIMIGLDLFKISYCLSTFRLIDEWIFLFQTDPWSSFHIPHCSAYLFTPVSIPTHRSACAPLYSNRIVVTYCRRSTIDFHYTTIELSDNYAIIILPKSKNCVDSLLKQKVYPKLRNGKPNT